MSVSPVVTRETPIDDTGSLSNNVLSLESDDNDSVISDITDPMWDLDKESLETEYNDIADIYWKVKRHADNVPEVTDRQKSMIQYIINARENSDAHDEGPVLKDLEVRMKTLKQMIESDDKSYFDKGCRTANGKISFEKDALIDKNDSSNPLGGSLVVATKARHQVDKFLRRSPKQPVKITIGKNRIQEAGYLIGALKERGIQVEIKNLSQFKSWSTEYNGEGGSSKPAADAYNMILSGEDQFFQNNNSPYTLGLEDQYITRPRTEEQRSWIQSNLVGANGLASEGRQPDHLKQELFLRAVEYKNNMNIEFNDQDKGNISNDAQEIKANSNPVDKFNEVVEGITTPSPRSSITRSM